MALFKCKSCGAPLDIKEGSEIAYCPYCGMKQTLPKDPVPILADGTSVDSLLKRAFMFLEDGDFSIADEYCERVLDIDPENARAYFGKLLVTCKVKTQEEFREKAFSKLLGFYFFGNKNCVKIMRLGNENLKNFFNDIFETLYNEGMQYMNAKDYARAETDFSYIIDFRNKNSYKDALQKFKKCREKLDELSYKDCIQYMEREKYELAEHLLVSLVHSKPEDSNVIETLKECLYKHGLYCMARKEWYQAISIFKGEKELRIFKDKDVSHPEMRRCIICSDYPMETTQFIVEHMQAYEEHMNLNIRGYKDVEEKILKCERELGWRHANTGCMTLIMEICAVIGGIFFMLFA